MTASADPVAVGLLRRASRNAGLLLSSKGISALMQLCTFALIARGLGPVEFGLFVLLQTHVQIVSGIATAESSQAVIHYGVRHVEVGDKAAFQSLVKAGALVDIGGAAVAVVLAIVLAPVIAGFLEWDAQIVAYAQWFAPVAMASAIATPRGMLRLFGEFGLLARHNLVTPAARLIGCAIAFLVGAPLPAYLAAWFVAAYAGAAVALWLGWSAAARRGLLAGMSASLRGLGSGSPGLWRFIAITNIHSTLAVAPNHLSVYLVGGLLGPAAAGLFKVARELATALSKPADLLNQALYPDLARLAHSGDWSGLAFGVIRAGLLAGLAAGGFLIFTVLFGEGLIAAVFGAEFGAAAPVLVLLVAASGIAMLVFATEPALYALRRPGTLLWVSVATNAGMFGAMPILIPRLGLTGAGWSALAGAVLGAALAALLCRAAIRRAARTGAAECGSP